MSEDLDDCLAFQLTHLNQQPLVFQADTPHMAEKYDTQPKLIHCSFLPTLKYTILVILITDLLPLIHLFLSAALPPHRNFPYLITDKQVLPTKRLHENKNLSIFRWIQAMKEAVVLTWEDFWARPWRCPKTSASSWWLFYRCTWWVRQLSWSLTRDLIHTTLKSNCTSWIGMHSVCPTQEEPKEQVQEGSCKDLNDSFEHAYWWGEKQQQ